MKPVMYLFFGVLISVLTFSSNIGAENKREENSVKSNNPGLKTRWANDVSAKNVHPEYPRPQMVRKDWTNLNGLWEYAVRPVNDEIPHQFDGNILVPFPIESLLSGVKRQVGPGNRLWYRRTFKMPHSWTQQRILLHFGAVDWETTVWVNDIKAGEHRGGYDPFTLDISHALAQSGKQEIVVAVWDPVDTGYQPRGKQVLKPGGIWYTPTTGIWQTVWLESVPYIYIKRLKIIPDIDESLLKMRVIIGGLSEDIRIKATVFEGSRMAAETEDDAGSRIKLRIKNVKLWSPDKPFLYNMEVMLLKGRKTIDRVKSYFGMRKISLDKDKNGVLRLFLNNKELFQFGPLDQGFWPDGIYTAPTDEAMRYDIEVTKKLGFNMARKHVKVEPDRWYYWCDKLGLLVWQDMPSGDRFIGKDDPDISRTAQSARQFELELKAIIDAFYNHPCIVMWVPFNEGWGQFDTARITELIRKYDPSRLVNPASGWVDRGVGDVNDIHNYPAPIAPENEQTRAAVLGEFGGLGLPVKEHTWQDEKNWGYQTFKDSEELTREYLNLLNSLYELKKRGLSSAVYTQTTDVEIEVNGLMTYDRAMIKMDTERIAEANKRLYEP